MQSAFVSLTLLFALASWQTPQTEPTPAVVFDLVRSRLLADMKRQPRYTCIQNITRKTYDPSSRKRRSCLAIIAAFDVQKRNPLPSSWDRLQLDVTIAENREIHAWPGTTRFSEDDVRRFVGSGLSAGQIIF